MKGGTFKAGDEVALSATFLRSICPNAAAGWPTTKDEGIGRVIEVIDGWLVDVEFANGRRKLNAFNLVHRKDIQREAMIAEHKPRFSD